MSGDSISLFQLLKEGGWAMWPLGCLSMTLFGLILHGWLQTSEKFFGSLPSRWFNNTVRDQMAALKISLSAHAGMLDSLNEQLFGLESKALRSIQYLNVIATIAPMVGLLGTVSGMIGAFQTIASGGMGKPELLAGDIGEALITTATGLTIGIPAMIFYFVLRNRLDSRIEETEAWMHQPEPNSGKPETQDAGA